MVGQLNLSLYGTRDAARNWAGSVAKTLENIGFLSGKASPCNFHHPHREISLTVHGDDFTSCGRESDLRWLEQELTKAYEIKTDYLGPDKSRGHLQELRILNRVITWTADGLSYEADQRHSELIIADLGLTTAKPVTSPGTKEDAEKARQENEAGKPLDKKEASLF